jgi:hypothetical protein
METKRLRIVTLRRLLQVLEASENDQSVVAAARTLLEAVGVLGARGRAVGEGEERDVLAMSPEAMARELAALSSLGGEKN